jgi:hypothetical protein
MPIPSGRTPFTELPYCQLGLKKLSDSDILAGTAANIKTFPTALVRQSLSHRLVRNPPLQLSAIIIMDQGACTGVEGQVELKKVNP